MLLADASRPVNRGVRPLRLSNYKERNDMRHKFILTAISLAYVLLTFQNAFSQESRFQFRVEIEVTADDSIKSEVSSYLNREIRSLGDVVITDNDPHLKISVLATENTVPKSYVISVVTSTPFSDMWKQKLAGDLSERTKSFWVKFMSDKESINQHFVQIGSDLSQVCKKVVALIDSEDIEPNRKEWQKATEILNRRERERKSHNLC
jgi:hypothetical protein